MIVREISFEQILPSWSQYLWPNRSSAIEPVSAIGLNGEYDMTLMWSQPYFWGVFLSEATAPAGVISGYQTSPRYFRSRGIWVQTEHRKNGIGSELLRVIEHKALTLNCDYVWTMPRVTSWPFYEKNHFEILHTIDKFEFGPHYIAVKNIG